MFKIYPLTDLSKRDKICNTYGIDPKDGYFIYVMSDYDTDAPMGISQFEITEEGGFISDIKEYNGKGDFEAMFILGRQTMNFIDKCGAHICYADASGIDESLLRAIGFKKSDSDRYVADMTGMFDGKCDGRTVSL